MDEGTRGRERSLPLFCVGCTALRAHGLRVERAGTLVLDGVDLCVAPGAQVALVGPNGAGKSTLVQVLKGLLASQAGTVSLAGVPVEGTAPEVGLVLANPEDQGVAPTVEDDVAFGLENLALDPGEIRRRVDLWLRRLGLWELRRSPIHALSGGECQKLALASVLAMGARFLLLDEPFAGIDPIAVYSSTKPRPC